MNEKQYLSRPEAAEYLASLGIPVKPQTLARWACSGRYSLPMIKLGTLVRYERADLDRLAAEHKVNPGE